MSFSTKKLPFFSGGRLAWSRCMSGCSKCIFRIAEIYILTKKKSEPKIFFHLWDFWFWKKRNFQKSENFDFFNRKIYLKKIKIFGFLKILIFSKSKISKMKKYFWFRFFFCVKIYISAIQKKIHLEHPGMHLDRARWSQEKRTYFFTLYDMILAYDPSAWRIHCTRDLWKKSYGLEIFSAK